MQTTNTLLSESKDGGSIAKNLPESRVYLLDVAAACRNHRTYVK